MTYQPERREQTITSSIKILPSYLSVAFSPLPEIALSRGSSVQARVLTFKPDQENMQKEGMRAHRSLGQDHCRSAWKSMRVWPLVRMAAM